MSKYILVTLTVGFIETNCYIFGCKKTKEAVIIDPGAEDDKIKEALEKCGLSAKFIINTHGHIDHIGVNKEFCLPVFIHKLDAAFLEDPEKNLSIILGKRIKSPPATGILEDGNRLDVGDLVLEVIHTPGHTPGSISIKCDDLVFTGDALFKGSIGRTDLALSSQEDLFTSIREKLLALPDSTKVYPGHGPETTIGYERKHNPFL